MKLKFEYDQLQKASTDPISQFLEIIKKISIVANSNIVEKNNYKKYVIDTFYSKVIISLNKNNNINSKLELSKVKIYFRF